MGMIGSSRWSAVDTGYIPLNREGVRQAYRKTFALRILPHFLFLAVGLLIGTCYPFYPSVYSRRPPGITSLLPRALPALPPTPIPPVSSLPPPEDPIPNIVHYVYGLAPGPHPDFPYYAYLAMRSAMTVLKPERVLFHCLTEPEGYWWDRVRGWEGWIDEGGERRGPVEVVQARQVQWIGQHRTPVEHYAHKADILRLEVLQAYGGIYLDIDVFVLRPFADYSLMVYDTVLGIESKQLDHRRSPATYGEMDPKGLCNAVILSRPNSTFLSRWIDTYDSFNGRLWADHSVKMPWTLARLYPTTVTVLSERAFFWPLWTPNHIHSVYKTTEYDFEASGQLAYHAWESLAERHLNALNPVTIQEIDSSFTRMARRFREPDEEARWIAGARKSG